MNSFRKTREIMDNRFSVIRDSVQYKRPFVIINFVTKEQQARLLTDLNTFGRMPYILQHIHSQHASFPSIFITNYGSTVSLNEFKELVKQIMRNYKIDSVVCLYSGGVSIVYKNGEHSSIGEEIYSSVDPNEFTSDYYQIDGKYYTFI